MRVAPDVVMAAYEPDVPRRQPRSLAGFDGEPAPLYVHDALAARIVSVHAKFACAVITGPVNSLAPVAWPGMRSAVVS